MFCIILLNVDVAHLLLVLDESNHALNHIIDVQLSLGDRPFTSKIEQPFHHLRRTLCFVNDQLNILAVLVPLALAIADQMRKGQDTGQGVVDFVSDSRSQASNGSQFLTSPNLLLGRFVELLFTQLNRRRHIVQRLTDESKLAGRPNNHTSRQVAFDHPFAHRQHMANGA